LAGAIPQYLMEEDYDSAKKYALQMASIFGPDRFYLELQDHGIEEQTAVNQGVMRLSRETGLQIKIIAPFLASRAKSKRACSKVIVSFLSGIGFPATTKSAIISSVPPFPRKSTVFKQSGIKDFFFYCAIWKRYHFIIHHGTSF
jgi:hypothetical protein